MRLVKIINLVRFNCDFIFVIGFDVLLLSKWCITHLYTPLSGAYTPKSAGYALLYCVLFFVSLMSSGLNFQTLIYFHGRPKDRRMGF